MSARPLRALVGARVRVGNLAIGDVRGVLLDEKQSRVLGLEIVDAGRARRFLPWVAAEQRGDGIRVASAFLLVDELESYARRGAVLLQAVADDDPREVSADGTLFVSRVREPGIEVMMGSPVSPARPHQVEKRRRAASSM